MNPEQALQILEQVRLNATLKGQDHDAARQAIMVLQSVIEENKSLKEAMAEKVTNISEDASNG